MAKRDEISSTEKLLSLIRKNKSSESDAAVATALPRARRNPRPRFKNAVTLKKKVRVGVDIGYDDLKLVKILSSSAQNHELLDYLRVPFEPDLSQGHPDFPKFLKKALTRFCGSSKNLEIWTCISSARVELRYLRIPKVPPKQVANAVYWSHKKVAPYKEGETIFDFEVLGEVHEDGVPKIAVVSFAAPQQEIQFYRSLFSKSGYPLKGISIVPFAFQNLLRTGWLRQEVRTVSSLYIGRDWSRIDVFSNGNLVLSRGIKAGIKTMNEAMRGEMSEIVSESGIDFNVELLDTSEPAPEAEVETQPKFDTERAQKIFFGLIHDVSPPNREPTKLLPEEEEIFRMILPALERLVQQVERTFEHYASNFDNDRVEKIYISSTVRPHRRIVDTIGDELGLPRETFDPFNTNPEFLGSVNAPLSEAERGSFAPAIGMALSSNTRTPNFLYTYKEKSKVSRSNLVNKVAMGLFFVVMLACVGFYAWQGRLIDNKVDSINRLQAQLAAFKNKVDQQQIIALVDQSRQKNEQFREFSRKYMSLVVLSELSDRTPSNVRLTSISLELGGQPQKPPEAQGTKPGGQKGKQPAKPVEENRNIIIEGIILGDRLVMEAVLAGYLLELSESPLFEQPAINSKEVGLFNEKEVLRFTARLKLV